MAAIARSNPQPLETHLLIPSRRKYGLIRMKEMLSNALSGSKGGGLFSSGDNDFPGGGLRWLDPAPANADDGDQVPRRQSLLQQAASQNKNAQAQAARKASASSIADTAA